MQCPRSPRPAGGLRALLLLALSLALIPTACLKTKDCDETLPCASSNERCFRGFCRPSCTGDTDERCAGDDEICRTCEGNCLDNNTDVTNICTPCLCEPRCNVDALEVCVDGACVATSLDLTVTEGMEVDMMPETEETFCVQDTTLCFTDFDTRFCKGTLIAP